MNISIEEYRSELSSFLSFLDAEKKKCFGIQMNQDADDCVDFAPFLKHTINNLGDPFLGKGGHLQTFKYERELVGIMSKLLHLNPAEAWGYYTSGSSISNLQAIHLAVEKLGSNVTLVTSKDAHNSICKAGSITRVKAFKEIATTKNGELCIESLGDFLKTTKKDERFIFCFCSGTVSKGAYDPIRSIIETIQECGILQDNYYLHLDAALGGMITPFISNPLLQLDFSIPQLDSLSVSFHKRLGIPVPGSLFLIRKSSFNFDRSTPFVEDYRSLDTTIAGSRDGITPFITLMKLRKLGFQELVLRTQKALEKAAWLAAELRHLGITTIHNEYAPCVYFEAPSDALIKEYHLPLYEQEDGSRFTHIFTMEHVSIEGLECFIDKAGFRTEVLKRIG
ncbi:pyridoxal-dependent decarboxylase [Flavobacteriaceae bacterium M23B6Z8]